MRNKLLITVLLALLLIPVLAACGTSTDAVLEAEVDVANLPDTIDVDTTAAIKDRDDVVLLDVREQWEYDEAHIPGVTLVPMGEVPFRLDEIPTDKTVILTCRSGNRSGQTLTFLQENGFTNVHNMAGGILAWQAAGFEVE